MSGRRTGRLLAAALSVVTLAVAVAACGSSSASSPSSTPAASNAASSGTQAATQPSAGTTKLSGSPVKIMVLATVGNPTFNIPEAFSGAQAAALALNKAGGINGHPVKIIQCNAQFNANIATSCIHTAVADHVVAVESLDLYGTAWVPILAKADIPYLPKVQSPIDWTSPDSYPTDGEGESEDLGVAVEAHAAGAKTMAMAVQSLAPVQYTANQIGQVWTKSYGGKVLGSVSVPTTATTFTAVVQKLRTLNADFVTLAGTSGDIAGILQAAAQSGYRPPDGWGTYGGPMTPIELKTLQGEANGVWTDAPLPPAGASAMFPGIKLFNSEMDAATAAGIPNATPLNRSDSAISFWASTQALAAVGDHIHGPVTAKSMTAQLNKTKNLPVADNLFDYSPGSRGPAGFPRITNEASVYIGKIQNGSWAPISKTPTPTLPLLIKAS